ncbi:MAG: hypothetical protein ACLR8P_13095 [Clostridium fessum]
MKNKVRQLFRDKLVLVMTVLGLLTIVAAAGTVKIRKDNAQDGRNPYLDVPQTEGITAGRDAAEPFRRKRRTRRKHAHRWQEVRMPRIRSITGMKPIRSRWRRKKRAVWEPEQLPHAHFPTMEPIA